MSKKRFKTAKGKRLKTAKKPETFADRKKNAEEPWLAFGDDYDEESGGTSDAPSFEKAKELLKKWKDSFGDENVAHDYGVSPEECEKLAKIAGRPDVVEPDSTFEAYQWKNGIFVIVDGCSDCDLGGFSPEFQEELCRWIAESLEKE